MPMSIERTYNLSELARTTGISRDTLAAWVQRGWLVCKCRAGKIRRYTAAEYDRACALSKGEKPLPERVNYAMGGTIDYEKIAAGCGVTLAKKRNSPRTLKEVV